MPQLQPTFILEGNAPVESSRTGGGDGDGGSVISSPAALPLSQADSPGPWQSESLLAESWSTMGDMDPEDTKSLDSSDGAVVGGDENHSSNSDMVHLEPEEAEMLEEAEGEAADVREEKRGRRAEDEEEEDEDLQTSVLSVLGGDKELSEMREEELQAPETEELLVSAEEPYIEAEPSEFMQVVPPLALSPLPIVRLEPPSSTSTPDLSTTTSEVEEFFSAQGLHPPSILAPHADKSQTLEHLKVSQIPLRHVEEHSTAPEKLEPTGPKSSTPLSSSELPVLLCGGAAFIAVVGVVTYGAVAYCRK